MFGRRRNRTADEPVRVARQVRLGEVADPDRTTTTLVDHPDSYTALDHAPGTTPVDRDAAIAYVVARVRAAVEQHAVDDEVPDWLDGHIDALRAGWDAAVEAESRERELTLRSLLGMELHHLTASQARLARLRAEAARLEADVAGWRRVLLGADEFRPEPVADEQPTAPRPVALGDALDASSGLHDDADLTALAVFDNPLIYAPKEHQR
ncbi:hypothetical protein [Cellulomonas composti]|uniref:Uncharacterized protein n=1 Tax=Cellulomonas composti TaxID=266130 RepID=A0A511JD89_9CELL|nr:hypothetical protein [Cellulomonas composti]GEL95967.1 hypothetical protein CCO02nite_26250 [Cellulomonas composti]